MTARSAFGLLVIGAVAGCAQAVSDRARRPAPAPAPGAADGGRASPIEAPDPARERASATLAAAAARQALVARGLLGAGTLLRAPAAPVCEDGRCGFRFEVIEPRGDGPLGMLHVDAQSEAVLWEPNDGRNRRFTLDAFAA